MYCYQQVGFAIDSGGVPTEHQQRGIDRPHAFSIYYSVRLRRIVAWCRLGVPFDVQKSKAVGCSPVAPPALLTSPFQNLSAMCKNRIVEEETQIILNLLVTLFIVIPTIGSWNGKKGGSGRAEW